MEYALKMIRVGEERKDSISQVKPALCFRGSKVAHAVINDETAVRAVVVTLQAYDLAPPVLLRGQPYPLARFVTHMREIGARKGLTCRAKALLEAPDRVGEGELPPIEDIPTATPVRAQETPSVPPETPAGLRKTATMPRSTPAATRASPLPPKTATKTAKPKPTAKLRDKYGGRGNTVRDLAEELKTDPKSLRVRLRAAGLHAPYTDIKAMKKALKIK